MRTWRYLLLVASLVVAQLLAGAHALEHAVVGDEALPTHTCHLCLAAQDLGAALPSLVSLPLLSPPQLVPASTAPVTRAAFPAPVACQRGPPLAC